LAIGQIFRNLDDAELKLMTEEVRGLIWRSSGGISGYPRSWTVTAWRVGCVLLLTIVFTCSTQGPVEKRRIKNVCHENIEETSYRGHKAAGAHPLREADHAECTLRLHCEVSSLCPTCCHWGAKHS